jgi:hypothetical protein
VLLLTNPGEACEVQVACGENYLSVQLTADSLTTLVWHEE